MATRKSMRITSVESYSEMMNDENVPDGNTPIRRSERVRTPSKKHEMIEKLLRKRTPSKDKLKNCEASDENISLSDEEDDLNDSHPIKPSKAMFSNTDIEGSHMFQFRTPKKRDGMKKLAENTPKTPTTLLKSMSMKTPNKTDSPSASLRALSLHNSPSTPKTPRTMAIRSAALQNVSTPSETRNKNKKVLHKRAQQTVQESETESSADEHTDYEAEDSNESSDDDSDVASSDEENVPKNVRKNIPSVAKTTQINTPQMMTRTRGRAKKKAYDDDFIPDSDNYFIAASNKKSKTSDHTLDRLKSSRLQHDELFSLLSSIHSSEEHQHRIADTLHELRQNFDRWMLEMQKGYNIIVYGTGSKQQLLHEFCEKYLHDKPLIMVNGFFPSLTTKDILQAIKIQLLEINANSRNDHEVVDLIASALDGMSNGHIFLVINNIDGVMLRKIKDQHILSRLAKIKNLHLIASIDHINAPLMWDQTCMDNFNFVWYDCTTMLPYKHETAFENSVFLQGSGELDLAAMNNVFRSLTTNARGIYMILVKNQLDNQKDSNYQGMTFKELYQKCRESFLVSSDSTLRTQLIEFVDHKMAKIKRSLDATELVFIPISSQILTLFTQQQNE